MNSSEYIRNIQNRSLFIFKRDNHALETKATSYDNFINTNLGELPFLVNGRSIDNFPLVPSAPPPPEQIIFTLQNALSWSTDTLLADIAKRNIGPTRCARVL